MRWAAAGVMPLVVVLAPEAAAHADTARTGASHTVVVLRTNNADDVTSEATARVQGELGAAGFRVVVMPVPIESAKTDVETAGSDLGAAGAFAIFVQPGNGGRIAEIWVSDRIRHMTVVERARLTETDHQRDSEALAVRAVELLKASLVEFWQDPGTPPPPPPPRAEPVPPPSPRPQAPTTRAAFAAGVGLGVGAGVVDAFGNVGALWLPSLIFAYSRENGVSVQLSLHGLGPTVTLSASNGTAKVEEQLASVDIVKTWWPRASVAPFACAGVGAQHVHASGVGVAPYAGTTVDDWSLWTSAGLGAAVPVYSGLSLVFESRAAVAWPPTAVRIAAVDAGHFGEPSLLMDAHVLGVFP